MRRWISLVLLAWTLLTPVQAAAFEWSSIFGGSEKGAYSFRWVDQSGAKHSLEEYKGRPLILHLWASWCSPCQEEMDSMAEWVKAHPSVIFIPVSLDHDIKKAAAFLSDRGIGFPALLTDEAQARKIGALSLPTTMVISAEGEVVQNHRGGRDWMSDSFSSRLLKDLESKDASLATDEHATRANASTVATAGDLGNSKGGEK